MGSTASAESDDLWHLDPIVYFALGGMLLFMGSFVLAAVGPEPIFLALCGLGGVLPGVIAVLYGTVALHRHKRLVAFAGFVKTYRRIHIDDLARKLGKDRMATEHLLAASTHRKLLKGSIDRTTDEFVLDVPAAQKVFIARCTNCGAPVNRSVFIDERVTCPYCEAGIEVPAPASTPMVSPPKA